AEAIEPTLVNVVAGAGVEQVGGGGVLLGTGAGQDDERDLRVELLQQCQGLVRPEGGQRLLRQHHVPGSLGEGGPHLLGGLHGPPAGRVVAAAFQFLQHSLHVVRAGIDDQHSKAGGHGRPRAEDGSRAPASRSGNGGGSVVDPSPDQEVGYAATAAA